MPSAATIAAQATAPGGPAGERADADEAVDGGAEPGRSGMSQMYVIVDVTIVVILRFTDSRLAIAY